MCRENKSKPPILTGLSSREGAAPSTETPKVQGMLVFSPKLTQFDNVDSTPSLPQQPEEWEQQPWMGGSGFFLLTPNAITI